MKIERDRKKKKNRRWNHATELIKVHWCQSVCVCWMKRKIKSITLLLHIYNTFRSNKCIIVSKWTNERKNYKIGISFKLLSSAFLPFVLTVWALATTSATSTLLFWSFECVSFETPLLLSPAESASMRVGLVSFESVSV